MIELGPTKGTIVSHRSRMIGDKLTISLTCKVGEEHCEALIWITDKSMGMARRALKLCGFDIDQHTLDLLDARPTMLANKVVPLMVDEYNGKQRVSIDLDQRAEKGTMDAVTKKLRAAKKSADTAPEDIPF